MSSNPFSNILNKKKEEDTGNWMRDQLNPYYKYMWITNLWVMYENYIFQ